MDIKIYNLDHVPLSDRNGSYGGNSGDKEGVLINGEYWIIKYPRNIQHLQNVGTIAMNTSPLSEYIGSHIYHILGYPVHDTILGIRDHQIVVACKDFCDDNHRLLEFRQLKNTHNAELGKALDRTFRSTGSDHFTNLDEIRLHLAYNPVIKNIPGISDRFWDCLIIDGFINNNDRNNGNWGILRSRTESILAPVYDNGSSFLPNLSEEKLRSKLADPRLLLDAAIHNVTAYSLDGIHNAHFSDILKLDIPELQQSIRRVVPVILQKLPECVELIKNIPECVDSYEIITPARKSIYSKSIQLCASQLLQPSLRQLQNEKERDMTLHHNNMER